MGSLSCPQPFDKKDFTHETTHWLDQQLCWRSDGGGLAMNQHQHPEELIKRERQILANPKHHYRLSAEVGFDVIDKNISHTAQRLWMYLCILFPFGDRPEQMPTQAELAARLGVSRRSISRAAAELEDAGLWAFKVESWKGQNLTGQNLSFPGRHRCHTVDTDVTPYDKNVTSVDTDVTPYDKNVTSVDTDVTLRSPEAAQDNGSTTPQIYSDYSRLLKPFHTQGECEEEKNSIEIPESEPAPQNSGQIAPLVHFQTERPQPIEQDKSSAAPPAPVEKFSAKSPYLHPTQMCDRSFEAPEWGSWRNPDEGFIYHLWKVYLPTIPSYKGVSLNKSHARQWLNRAKFSEERYEDAVIQWEAYQDSLNQSRHSEQLPRLARDPIFITDEVVAKERSQRLATLNVMLSRGEQGRVKELLGTHPDWGLQLVNGAVVEVAS